MTKDVKLQNNTGDVLHPQTKASLLVAKDGTPAFKAKTDEDKQVAIGEDGKAYYKGSSGSSGIQSVSTLISSGNITTTVTGSDGKAVSSTPVALPKDGVQSVTNSISGDSLTTTVTGADGQQKSSNPVTLPKYTLTAANSSNLGGIKADAKTDADNIPVKIDPVTHKAFVAPVNKITITDNGDGTVNIDVS